MPFKDAYKQPPTTLHRVIAIRGDAIAAKHDRNFRSVVRVPRETFRFTPMLTKKIMLSRYDDRAVCPADMEGPVRISEPHMELGTK